MSSFRLFSIGFRFIFVFSTVFFVCSKIYMYPVWYQGIEKWVEVLVFE